jgi:hypothetical protein
MGGSDAQKLKTVEDANRRLKKLPAGSMLDIAARKDRRETNVSVMGPPPAIWRDYR